MDKQAFTDFLLTIGFNKNGADEVIKRFEEDRPDMNDLGLYKSFAKAAKHK